MQFSEDSRYAFAVGRVRSKETALLKRSDYERLVNLTNENEILNNLKTNWPLENPERENLNLNQLFQLAEAENQAFFTTYCLDAQVTELILNPHMLKSSQLTNQLKSLANQFLNLYFQSFIDLENLRSLLRIKNLAQREKQDLTTQKKLLANVLLNGGTIQLMNFFELLASNWQDIIQWSNTTPYQTVVEAGINYLLEKRSFLRFERLANEYKQQILLLSRYCTFGYEPLVAYYLLKESEIRNLRKIAYGIIEQTPKDEIKESIACVL
ncbi:MAG: V-type ATPase subunit [candidate division WOR-3 bacterium]